MVYKKGRGFNLIICVVLVVIAAFFLSQKVYAVNAGDASPDFNIATLEGKLSYERDLKGRRPVYIFFWSSW